MQKLIRNYPLILCDAFLLAAIVACIIAHGRLNTTTLVLLVAAWITTKMPAWKD